jgi:mRNA deadenylase 3'-5' endonuclease subunit Ccr4
LAQEGSEFTTWKFRSSGAAKRTIDFILYTHAQLVPTSRWRMLSEAEIGPAGLPNTRYPSDHMAVACQFSWRGGAGGT